MYGQNWLEGRQVVGLCLKKSGVQSTSYPYTAMTKQSKCPPNSPEARPFPCCLELHQAAS